jgi:hypothetical protein
VLRTVHTDYFLAETGEALFTFVSLRPRGLLLSVDSEMIWIPTSREI